MERRDRGALDAGLLVARLALGLPFLFHGAAIAFGAFGGPGLHGFAAYSKLPLPLVVLVGYGQFLGGLGILLGVLSRIASAGMVVIMLGAIALVHWPHGYDVTKNGMEHPLSLLLLAVALVITGPGAYTVRALLGGQRPTSALPPTASPLLQ